MDSIRQDHGSLLFGGENVRSGDGIVAGLPPSPDCWLRAIRAMEMDSTSTADACNWMTTQHQKIMALEMARCHVHDLGHMLFEQSSITGLDSSETTACSHENYRQHLAICLTHLTPSAETAYTHFMTYINQLCTRLSREVVMDYFYETSVNLAKASVDVGRQFKEMLQYQEELRETWNERETETAMFHERFRQDVYQERLRWAKESALLRSQWQQDQEEWLLRQKEARKSQLEEIAGQQRELRRQKNELARLAETVARTNQSIQPWSLKLQNLYQYLQNAYHILKWVLHLAGSTMIMWIFTMPRCLHWIRKYMLVWIVTGGLIEIVLVSLQHGGRSSHEEINEISTLIRGAMGVLEIVFYLLGALISPCFRSGYQDTVPTSDCHRYSLSSDDDERQVPSFPVHQEASIQNDPMTRSHWQLDQRYERIMPYPMTLVHPSPLSPANASARHGQEQHWANLQHLRSDRMTVTPNDLLTESPRVHEQYFDPAPAACMEKEPKYKFSPPSFEILKGAEVQPLDSSGTTQAQGEKGDEKRRVSGHKRPCPESSNDSSEEDTRSPKRPRLLNYSLVDGATQEEDDRSTATDDFSDCV